MAANKTTINIQFTTTSSVQFNAPVQRSTILDSVNRGFLRQMYISNDGVKIISTRTGNVVQIPTSSLFAAAAAADPTMTWAPIIVTQPTSSVTVTSPLGFGINITASAETALTYAWYAQPPGSSSFYALPLPGFPRIWTGSVTPSLYVSQSLGLNTFQLECVVSNVAGQTTSSFTLINAL